MFFLEKFDFFQLSLQVTIKKNQKTSMFLDGNEIANDLTEHKLSCSILKNVESFPNTISATIKIEGEKNIKVKMISKLMEGTYPNYRQVVPVELKHSLALSREELLNAVARAELMTSERSHIVNLSFGNNQLTISSHSAEVGEAKETLMINHEGPEIVISFNPTFLMDPLKTLDDSEIYLEINDEFSPALLRAKENSKFVVMPMRPPTA